MDCPAVRTFRPTSATKRGIKIRFLWCWKWAVTPLREKMGNYDTNGSGLEAPSVTPLREKMGNYDY